MAVGGDSSKTSRVAWSGASDVLRSRGVSLSRSTATGARGSRVELRNQPPPRITRTDGMEPKKKTRTTEDPADSERGAYASGRSGSSKGTVIWPGIPMTMTDDVYLPNAPDFRFQSPISFFHESRIMPTEDQYRRRRCSSMPRSLVGSDWREGVQRGRARLDWSWLWVVAWPVGRSGTLSD